MFPHLSHGDTIGKQPHLFQFHPLPSLEGATQGIGIHRLHADHLRFRPQPFDVGGDARDQATATHGHIDRIGWLLGLAHDLHADRSLACDHFRIVEGVNEGEPLGLAASLRLCGALVVGLAMENHVTTQGTHGAHFHLGCGAWHHDHGPTAKPLGTQGDALGMVPGTGGNHTALELVSAELRHAVVGAAQLEREHRLEILTLQPDRVVQPAAQIGCGIQRGFPRHVVDAGTQDPLQVVGHLTILPRVRSRQDPGWFP